MFRRLRDLDVHAQIAGPQEAEVLLFLHSLGTNLHVWDAQAESLSSNF
jgi:pimeloyl-ACP methyl ester carboxylesterase